MTQCMETWLIADLDVLATYYGQGFKAGALPKRVPLDGEPKTAVYDALDAATKKTQKGRYGKIRHASDLLQRLRPDVIAKRCESFRDFEGWLAKRIGAL